MIKARSCELVYKDGTNALKPFDLSIDKGEWVYVTGPSGSGKTSLMKIMMGMVQPSGGVFELMGCNMAHASEQAIRRLRCDIGPIFQEFRLIEGRTVMENVYVGMRFLDISGGDMKKNMHEALERVGLLHKMHQTVDRLSWGERQRVAIARAVARKPHLILADEPTGNLDPDNAMNILSLLQSFVDQQTTVIVTTHATHLIPDTFQGVHLFLEAGHVTCVRGGQHAKK